MQELKSISQQITKKKKEHNKKVLLPKSKLNSIEILISKVLIDFSITHDEFVLINNVLKRCDNRKKENRNLKTETGNQRFWAIYKNNVMLLFDL